MKNIRPSRVLTFAVIAALLPFLVTFDSLTYFITKPACLNCGSLIDFVKQGSSLTVFMMTTLGYKLTNHHG